MCKSQINTPMWKHKFSLDIIKLDIIFGDSKYDSCNNTWIQDEKTQCKSH